MDELTFQTKLRDAAIQEGGFCQKLTNRFTSGVVDLLVKMPEDAATMVECKFESIARFKVGAHVTVHPTQLQIDFMERWEDAGGRGGLALCIASRTSRDFYIFAEAGLCRKRITLGVDNFIIRKHGTPWPIREILARIPL